MDAGQLDPIVGRDNIANVLDQFSQRARASPSTTA
jgi:hypothetical protein